MTNHLCYGQRSLQFVERWKNGYNKILTLLVNELWILKLVISNANTEYADVKANLCCSPGNC